MNPALLVTPCGILSSANDVAVATWLSEDDDDDIDVVDDDDDDDDDARVPRTPPWLCAEAESDGSVRRFRVDAPLFADAWFAALGAGLESVN